MTRNRTTRTLARIALVAPLLAFAACGGDDDDATDTTAAAVATSPATDAPDTTSAATDAPTTAAPTTDAPAPTEPTGSEPGTSVDPALEGFCSVAAEMFELDGPPTPELLQEYADAAPPEIADQVTTVMDALEAAGGDFTQVFADPDAGAAMDDLTAFEGEACGLGEPVDEEATTIDPDATLVEVVATDYHFDVELPTDAGRYSFSMTNDGAEPHLMILAQLEEGAELAEVMASEGETGLIQMIESNVAAPGEDAVVTADLAPGNWVLVCPIPDAAGTSHAELGMVHEFEIA